MMKKSKEEQEFDFLNEQYEQMFGEPYVFQIGYGGSWEETLKDIRRCIETGKPQELHEYPSGTIS